MDIKVIVKRAREIAKEVESLPDDLRLITFEKVLAAIITSYDAETDRTTERAKGRPEKREKAKKAERKSKKPKKGKGRKKESWKPDGNLDLTGGISGKSLIELYKDKQPKNNYEKTTLFVYYLAKVLNIDNISYEQIYTCYKEVGQKVPKALKQNVRDIQRINGWLELEDGYVVLTTGGENLVEHVLPKDKN